jgi:RNase P subunit RPR2
MTSQRPQIFVSHYGNEKGEIKELLFPLQYLPFDLYIAIEEREFGEINKLIEDNLMGSEIVIPYITEDSVDNIWVNQEIGFAYAMDSLILPIFEESGLLDGFISNTIGVKVYEDDKKTMHEVVSYIRNKYEPMATGPYDWYLEFLCPHCSQENRFPISKTQEALWNDYQNGHSVARSCVQCGTEHSFNPASFEYEG